MALIDCPECGATISERAPTCPKCGLPIASPNSNVASAEQTAEVTDADMAPAAEPERLPTERSAEPLRIGGRRVPIAALLCLGGVVVGVAMKAASGGDQIPTPYRYIPLFMIFGGILWFSVTEFTMLIRHRKRR
jgi:hypothetical protein